MTTESSEEIQTFADLGLDNRLVKGLSKHGIDKPTLIQSSAIPFGLQGKDILAKAKTGSGKTLAYVLPVVHRLLTEDFPSASINALVLVPSRDLAAQVMSTLASHVLAYCGKEVQAVNLAGDDSLHLQRTQIASARRVIAVSTPSRALPHLAALKATGILVVDEADLILGFGHGPDMEQLVAALPHTRHALLLSASITPEVEELKSLLLHSAVTLKLEDEHDEQENLKQFTISCSAEDKFLLVYVVLKLRLLKGKILIFVNDVDRSYKLKLFLEQFGIRSCVVNGELPLASRHHIVEEYNRGVYDLLIASDNALSTAVEKKSVKRKGDNEAVSVARGIDFKRVDVVLNFDFPTRLDSYIHRVGRTARAGAQGTAISLVNGEDEQMLALVSANVQEQSGKQLAPYAFDMAQIEGFRYRCQDALRAVTGAAVREARLKDLKRELMTSERLKTFFAERPKDMELLKHDRGLLSSAKLKPHLKHVPDYLVKRRKMAEAEASDDTTTSTIQPLPQTAPAPSNRQQKQRSGQSGKPRKDPLKAIKRRS